MFHDAKAINQDINIGTLLLGQSAVKADKPKLPHLLLGEEPPKCWYSTALMQQKAKPEIFDKAHCESGGVVGMPKPLSLTLQA